MCYYQKAICPRCRNAVSGAEYDPCPHCRPVLNVNYETIYDLRDAQLPQTGTEKGMYRFSSFFSLEDDAPHISIGEGDTPLRRLDRLGAVLGSENLYMKDESRNPTGSHKDRLCSLIVSQAVYKKAPGIVIASTGNQGVSAAAYAKVAGLPCVVITTPNVSPTMKMLMQAYGAYVLITPTMNDRIVLLEKIVRELGFEPASGIWTPPIGSNFRAIDAYKTISFEVYQQMQGVPDWFIVPSSYGDTLFGIYKGMQDLKEMQYIARIPKMVAAEVFGATKKSVEATDDIPVQVQTAPSVQTSIAVGSTAYQTVKAIRSSGGTAENSLDEEALDMQKQLAYTEGIFAEPSSLASLVVLKKLLQNGTIRPEEKVVALITSEGVKDPASASRGFPEIPTIEPTLEAFYQAMEQNYHHPIARK